MSLLTIQLFNFKLLLLLIALFIVCCTINSDNEIKNLSNCVVFVETKIKETGSTDTNGDIILFDLNYKKKHKITDDNYYDYLPFINAVEKNIYFISNRNSNQHLINILQESTPRSLFYYSVEERRIEEIIIHNTEGKIISDLGYISNMIYSAKTNSIYFTHSNQISSLNLKSKILSDKKIEIEDVSIFLKTFITEDEDKIIMNCIMTDITETGLFIYDLSANTIKRIKDQLFEPLVDVKICGYNNNLDKYYIFRKSINPKSYERDDIEIYEFFPISNKIKFKVKINKTSKLELGDIHMFDDEGFFYVDDYDRNWGDLAYYNLETNSKNILTSDDLPKGSFNYYIDNKLDLY